MAVEVFAEIACPFTHVALRRFVAAAPDVGLRVRAWPLEWVNGRPLDPDDVAREVTALRREVAPDLFSGFDAARVPRTSIPAFGLAAAAHARSPSTGLDASLRLRWALFEEGADLTDPAVLGTIGAELDVPPLDGARAEQVVRADWEDGRRRGVEGSPTFFVGGRGYFCPLLDISQHDDELDVRIDEDAADAFLARVRASSDA